MTILLGIGALFIKFSKEDKALIANPPAVVSIPENSYIYFWSKTCPHCTNVSEFIDSWSGKDKTVLTKIEINESDQNRDTFLKTSQSCDIPDDQKSAVPLLVTPEDKCILGDNPIIDYLKTI